MPRFDLKNKREELGVSQLKLCIHSRVSRWRVRLHEQGLLDLRADELERIKQALKQITQAAVPRTRL